MSGRSVRDARQISASYSRHDRNRERPHTKEMEAPPSGKRVYTLENERRRSRSRSKSDRHSESSRRNPDNPNAFSSNSSRGNDRRRPDSREKERRSRNTNGRDRHSEKLDGNLMDAVARSIMEGNGRPTDSGSGNTTNGSRPGYQYLQSDWFKDMRESGSSATQGASSRNGRDTGGKRRGGGARGGRGDMAARTSHDAYGRSAGGPPQMDMASYGYVDPGIISETQALENRMAEIQRELDKLEEEELAPAALPFAPMMGPPVSLFDLRPPPDAVAAARRERSEMELIMRQQELERRERELEQRARELDERRFGTRSDGPRNYVISQSHGPNSVPKRVVTRDPGPQVLFPSGRPAATKPRDKSSRPPTWKSRDSRAISPPRRRDREDRHSSQHRISPRPPTKKRRTSHEANDVIITISDDSDNEREKKESTAPATTSLKVSGLEDISDNEDSDTMEGQPREHREDVSPCSVDDSSHSQWSPATNQALLEIVNDLMISVETEVAEPNVSGQESHNSQESDQIGQLPDSQTISDSEEISDVKENEEKAETVESV